MTIGQKIRAFRKQRGLTQAQLGELCGISGASIGSYEKGATIPKRRVMDKIAAAVGVSVDKLLEAPAPSVPPARSASSSESPLYDGVLAALKELYGTVEGRVVLGESGTSKKYYLVRGVSDSFVLYEQDIAAIAKSARATMSPLMERLAAGRAVYENRA